MANDAAILTSDANVGFSNAEKFLTNSNDTINLLAVDASAGNKNVTIIDDSTADNDVVKIIQNANLDLTNLKVTNIETLEINNVTDAALALGAANFTGLKTVNLSGVGFATGLDISELTVTVNGTDKDDVIEIGTAFRAGTVINGGKGNDTVAATAKTETINISKGALTGIENLNISNLTTGKVSFYEGGGITSVDTTALIAAGSVVFHGTFTNATETVEKSGEYNIDTVNKKFTYFDNVIGEAVTITFTGNAATFAADADAGTITATV